MAAAVGFAAGIIMGVVFAVVFVSVLGGRPRWTEMSFDVPLSALLPSLGFGLMGVVVAATAWLIIRPDRERQGEP